VIQVKVIHFRVIRVIMSAALILAATRTVVFGQKSDPSFLGIFANLAILWDLQELIETWHQVISAVGQPFKKLFLVFKLLPIVSFHLELVDDSKALVAPANILQRAHIFLDIQVAQRLAHFCLKNQTVIIGFFNLTDPFLTVIKDQNFVPILHGLPGNLRVYLLSKPFWFFEDPIKITDPIRARHYREFN
jgi:hypothetical protein